MRGRDFRVLVCGGGVAGLEAMLALRELAGELVDVELVAPEHHFFYRPLAVAEPFGGPPVFQAHVAELASGQRIRYDAVVLACGARPEVAVAGALTFRGRADVGRFRALLDEVKSGEDKRLVFVVPSGIVWPLPLYELALLTATEFEREGREVALVLVTSEPRPLALFGARASGAVEALLAEHRIDVRVTASSPFPA